MYTLLCAYSALLIANLRARFSIIQKYSGGHRNRIQWAALGAIGAKTTSLSSRRMAFTISIDIFSGLAPLAVDISVTKNSKLYD